MSYLIDTNILLRSVAPDNSMYPIATNGLKELRRRNEQLYIVPQNIIEFWNVYTRPKEKNGLGGTITEVKREIKRLKSFFSLLCETEKIYLHWENLVSKYQVKGINVHDAKLVASMLTYDLTHILTFNIKDFTRYQEIIAVHPNELM